MSLFLKANEIFFAIFWLVPKITKKDYCFGQSVRMEQLGLHTHEFSWNLILRDISKICIEISIFIKILLEKLIFCMKINFHLYYISLN